MYGLQSKPSSSPPNQFQGQQYQRNHTPHTRGQTPPQFYPGPPEADPEGTQLSGISFQTPFQYSNIPSQFVPQFRYDLNSQAYAAPRMPVGGNPTQAAMYQATGVRQQQYFNQSSMRPSGYQISQPQPSQGLYTQQQIMFMPPPQYSSTAQVIMPMTATNYPQRMSSPAYQNSMPTTQGLFQLPQENTANFTPHARTHTHNNPPAVFYNAAQRQNKPPSASGMSGQGQPPAKKRERTLLQIIDPNSGKDIMQLVQQARGTPPSSGTLGSHGTVSGQEISHTPQNETAAQFAVQVAQVALSTHTGGNQPRVPTDVTQFAVQAAQSTHPDVNQQKTQSYATLYRSRRKQSTDQGGNQQRTLSDAKDVKKDDRGKKKAKDINRKGETKQGSEMDAFMDLPTETETSLPMLEKENEDPTEGTKIQDKVIATETNLPPPNVNEEVVDTVDINVENVDSSDVSIAVENEKNEKLKLECKEDQFSVINGEGKKQYDGDVLLQLQNAPESTLKPLVLPDIPDIIIKKIEDQQSRLHKDDDLVEGDAMSQAGLPPEILRMDERSQQLYKEALETGKVKVYNIRLMIVGHLGVGKTTLTKRILDEEVGEAPHVPTEGIEVHPRCCKIDLVTKKWIVEKREDHFPDNSQCLVNIVSEYFANKGEKSKDNVNREENNSIQHLTKDSGSTPVPNELDQKMSKSDVMQTDTNSASDKNTLCQEENVQENQTSLDLNKSQSAQTDSNETNALRMINNTKNHSDLNELVTKYRTMTLSDKTFCYVTMLDFAGEFFFYTTHQAFMSWRTLYLLVTDISKSLDDSVEGDECSMKRSIQDYVVYWFNSIYSHGIPNETSPQCEGRTQGETENDDQNCDEAAKYPPVILVATHSDKLSDKLSEEEKNKIKKKYFDGVRKIFGHRPQRFLLKETIAISNFGPANDIDALKQKMFELAEKQGYWGEEIPGRWLTLEQKLMELKRRGVKIIEYSHVEEINTSCAVKIENPDELKVFLRYEHDLGNIVFFDTEKLRGKVVLDPVWIIDGVRNLASPKPYMTNNHPEIHPEWYKFKCTGQLNESLIGHLWSGDGHEDFAKNGEHLLDLMEKLSIITKPVKKDSNVQDQKLCYWVPCMIDKPAPDHVKNGGLCEGITRTSTLGFVSKTEFIHVGVFHRLLASFLSIWQPVKENNDEYRLYSDCCEFELDESHSLLLIMNDYVIFATILRCEEEDPDNELCCSIKERISSTLKDITSCISPNVKFDMHVKCDKCLTYTVKGLHSCSKKRSRCYCRKPDHSVNVENLMRFWERKDNCQQQQEAVRSNFLNAAKQRDDATLHDSPGAVGMDKNLGLQDKTRLSFKDQAGNMKAEIDQTEAVFVHDLLAQRAKSVGMIRSPGTCGTGFRVGPHYIMTAKHVVDQIMNGTPVPLRPLMHVHPYHPLSNDAVFIDFSYERDGIPSGENLRFYFEPEIVYSNEDLDTVVLKLKPDSREYPPPLTNFHDVAHSPQDRSHGYFIGHSRASIKKTDRYNFVMPTPDTITAAKKWSMDQVNVDGYVGIDDPNRVLFNCTFERGASGAPGLWICPRDGNAYVELMLLRGYPSWYYDDKHKDKAVGIGSKFLVEQGVTMKSIYDDMHIRNEPLWKEIFVMRL